MLSIDSLVTDLIFRSDTELNPEDLLDALGGEEAVAKLQILDPDMQDPRFEMELSPSMPFRRRGERRLMIIDDSVAPMRKDPRTETVVPIDLRPAKEHLVALCEKLPVRLGRIFALGSWGDAVLVARSARDLRGISLIGWALDPTVDVEGRRRATQLSQAEFEEKLLAYDKRLDELDEQEILKNLGPARFERRGELLILDVLEDDGSWDLKSSISMENGLAAIERFSLIPGAKSAGGTQKTEAPSSAKRAPAAKPSNAPAPAKPAGPPLKVSRVGTSVILVFPRERFDLDVAAALGKRDWESILSPVDVLSGQDKDTIFEHGADFVAPIEFLSEVFVEGKPLTKSAFEDGSTTVNGARAMQVHFPRFGEVLLVAKSDGSRFVSSMLESPEKILELLG